MVFLCKGCRVQVAHRKLTENGLQSLTTGKEVNRKVTECVDVTKIAKIVESNDIKSSWLLEG